MKRTRISQLTSSSFHGTVKKLCLFSLIAAGTAFANQASVATLSVGSTQKADFCTKSGKFTIVHSCIGADPAHYSQCSIGNTFLSGPRAYHLGGGNNKIVPGCYHQKLASTTVTGSATANSTLYYD